MKPAILEIDLSYLDEDAFYPDEDFIGEAAHSTSRSIRDLVPIESRKGESLADTIKRVDVESVKSLWSVSLQMLGNISYRGTIPARAIKRYAVLDASKMPNLVNTALDASIHFMNFRFCGAHHRSLAHFVFDGTPVEPISSDIDDPTLQAWLDALEAERASGVEIVRMGKKSITPPTRGVACS